MIWRFSEKQRFLLGKLWHIDPQKIEVVIPRDVHVDGDTKKLSGKYDTVTLKRKMSLNSMLHRFCLRVAGICEVDSAPVLKYALLIYLNRTWVR